MTRAKPAICAAALVAALMGPAHADEGGRISSAPLPLVDDQFSENIVYSAGSHHEIAHENIIDYLQARGPECPTCGSDVTNKHLNYYRAVRFQNGSQNWQGADNVGVAVRNGGTAFGVWADTREVTSFSNEDVYFLPTGVSNANTGGASTATTGGSTNIADIGLTNDSVGNTVNSTVTNTTPTVPSASVSPGISADSAITSNTGGASLTDAPALRTAPSTSITNTTVSRSPAPVSAAPAPVTRAPAPVAAAPAPVASAPAPASTPTFTGGTSNANVGGVQSTATIDARAASASSELAFKEYVGGLFLSQSF